MKTHILQVCQINEQEDDNDNDDDDDDDYYYYYIILGFDVPASEADTAEVEASKATCVWLSSTAEKTVHLINKHLQCPISVLNAVSS